MDKVTFAFVVFTGNRGVIHKLCKGIDVEIVDTYVNVCQVRFFVEYLRHFMGIIVKTEKTVGNYTRRLLHIHKYNSVTYVS